MNNPTRIIKKYPNRRLYDTEQSCYITQQDLKNLVFQSIEFTVVDARTEEDLTNITLLQIILEQEESNSPLFTRQILQNMIRFYGDSMQSLYGSYLEQSMNLFLEQQDKLKQGMNVFLENNPLNFMKDIAERNMSMWQSLQENFMSMAKNPPKKEEK